MSTRTRAEAFARSLEDGDAGEHQPLVDALGVARTRLAPATTPDTQFRERLRTRLLAVATVQEAAGSAAATEPAPARRARWLRPVAGVLAGLVLLVGALVGVDAAARDSLPGDLLYGVKKAHQQYDVRREDGPVAQGIARLVLAQERLGDLNKAARRGSGTALGSPGGTVLASGSRTGLVRDGLRDIDRLTVTGSRQVEGAVEVTGDTDPLKVIDKWADAQADGLTDLREVAPTGVEGQLDASLTLVRTLQDRTRERIGLR